MLMLIHSFILPINNIRLSSPSFPDCPTSQPNDALQTHLHCTPNPNFHLSSLLNSYQCTTYQSTSLSFHLYKSLPTFQSTLHSFLDSTPISHILPLQFPPLHQSPSSFHTIPLSISPYSQNWFLPSQPISHCLSQTILPSILLLNSFPFYSPFHSYSKS